VADEGRVGCGDLVEALLVAADDVDGRATGLQAAGRGQPDAGGAPDDQRGVLAHRCSSLNFEPLRLV
jgi:hypothetical protein